MGPWQRVPLSLPPAGSNLETPINGSRLNALGGIACPSSSFGSAPTTPGFGCKMLWSLVFFDEAVPA